MRDEAGRRARQRRPGRAEGVAVTRLFPRRAVATVTTQALAWSQIASVRSPVTPVGVTLERRDGGPAVRIPALTFDVRLRAIAEALDERRRTALRR